MSEEHFANSVSETNFINRNIYTALNMALESIIVFCLTVTSALAIDHPDYCQDKYNCKGEKHVGCNNPLWNGGFGAQCKDAVFANITCKLEDTFIDTFNKHRNEIALGKTPHYDKAKRMATIQWDWDMHDVATLTARSCIFDHDKCRNTEKFQNSGQGLAIVYEDIPNYQSDEHYASAAIDSWFDEAAQNGEKYGWMKIINSFSQTDPNKEIAHFAQMVMDGAYAVGCAQTRFTSKLGGQDRKTTLTVCNYAILPVIEKPIYIAGETASDCKTGKNSRYPGLCSEKEKY